MTHHYLSTACVHEQHDRCRQRCKYCDARCTCSCHGLDGLRAYAVAVEQDEDDP